MPVATTKGVVKSWLEAGRPNLWPGTSVAFWEVEFPTAEWYRMYGLGPVLSSWFRVYLGISGWGAIEGVVNWEWMTGPQAGQKGSLVDIYYVAAHGTPMPAQDCLVIRRQSAAREKHGRGRVYLGPITDTYLTGHTRCVVRTTDAALVLGVDQLFLTRHLLDFDTGLPTWPVRPCLWDRKTLTASIITSWSINPLIGVQRRRRTIWNRP